MSTEELRSNDIPVTKNTSTTRSWSELQAHHWNTVLTSTFPFPTFLPLNCLVHISVQFSSFAQSCPTLCDLMDCSMQGFPVHHQFLECAQLMSIELVMPSNHLILCHPLLLLPSIFPSIRVFSNESVLCIRWPKDWSFSFSISPSNEYSGLISFRWTGWIS